MISSDRAFCSLVRLFAPSASSASPLVGFAVVVFRHVAPSTRNSANWLSNAKLNSNDCCQFWKDEKVSFSVNVLIFGDRFMLVAIDSRMVNQRLSVFPKIKYTIKDTNDLLFVRDESPLKLPPHQTVVMRQSQFVWISLLWTAECDADEPRLNVCLWNI